MSNMRAFDQLYSIAPEAAVQRLSGFRERVPMRNIDIGKNIYPVWDIGQGPRAAVFLPSGMGHGEIWFPYMMELSGQMRCVAISLAVNNRIEDYCKDIHELLERLGVKRVCLIAHAIGSLIAQTYVRMYPEQVESLVLCMAGAPAKGLSKDVAERWIRRREIGKKLRFNPFFNTMKPRLAYQTYESMCPPELEESLVFWRAFISETYQNFVYKKQYIALNCVAIPDIYERLPFDVGDLDNWQGKILLIDADGDHYYSDDEKAALRRLYPAARIEKLGSAGQFSLQADERRAIGIIRDFIKGDKQLPSSSQE